MLIDSEQQRRRAKLSEALDPRFELGDFDGLAHPDYEMLSVGLGGFRQLTRPFHVFDIDFAAPLVSRRWQVTEPEPVADGTAHAVAFWWDLWVTPLSAREDASEECRSGRSSCDTPSAPDYSLCPNMTNFSSTPNLQHWQQVRLLRVVLRSHLHFLSLFAPSGRAPP
jgi:hypothetical protein